jgi:predicted nucleotidyltransferase
LKARRRILVAKEAARLLYYHFVEDYKSAKEVACQNLGIDDLPHNFEVALELDELVDDVETSSRGDLLKDMRTKALQIMTELQSYDTKLIGSVWRGTPRKGSDIDIIVYSDKTKEIVDFIRKTYADVKTEYPTKTSNGKTQRFFHIYFTFNSIYNIEIVVRRLEEKYQREKCEIYGDYMIGLTRRQLSDLLEQDVWKKFRPEKKIGYNL